ncbi:MAG: hypothetical protein LBH74_08460 [Nitrososphaerota archaeon]|jgi:transposase-like protein|nr:hypothetical protein [Nitrososphaerota archaeon]
MCILLYSLSKASYTMLAKIFDTWPSLVYRWIIQAEAQLPDTEISDEICEIEFDEMWHFVVQKKQALDPQSR